MIWRTSVINFINESVGPEPGPQPGPTPDPAPVDPTVNPDIFNNANTGDIWGLVLMILAILAVGAFACFALKRFVFANSTFAGVFTLKNQKDKKNLLKFVSICVATLLLFSLICGAGIKAFAGGEKSADIVFYTPEKVTATYNEDNTITWSKAYLLNTGQSSISLEGLTTELLCEDVPVQDINIKINGFDVYNGAPGLWGYIFMPVILDSGEFASIEYSFNNPIDQKTAESYNEKQLFSSTFYCQEYRPIQNKRRMLGVTHLAYDYAYYPIFEDETLGLDTVKFYANETDNNPIEPTGANETYKMSDLETYLNPELSEGPLYYEIVDSSFTITAFRKVEMRWTDGLISVDGSDKPIATLFLNNVLFDKSDFSGADVIASLDDSFGISEGDVPRVNDIEFYKAFNSYPSYFGGYGDLWGYEKDNDYVASGYRCADNQWHTWRPSTNHLYFIISRTFI